MAEQVIKIAALGRRFQLGDLYNNHNDCIVSGKYFLRFHIALIFVALKNQIFCIQLLLILSMNLECNNAVKKQNSVWLTSYSN
jgi:hypothetical protein